MTAAAAEWDLVATLEPGNYDMSYLSRNVIPVRYVSSRYTCLPGYSVILSHYVSTGILVMSYLSHHDVPVLCTCTCYTCLPNNHFVSPFHSCCHAVCVYVCVSAEPLTSRIDCMLH